MLMLLAQGGRLRSSHGRGYSGDGGFSRNSTGYTSRSSTGFTSRSSTGMSSRLSTGGSEWSVASDESGFELNATLSKKTLVSMLDAEDDGVRADAIEALERVDERVADLTQSLETAASDAERMQLLQAASFSRHTALRQVARGYLSGMLQSMEQPLETIKEEARTPR